MTHYLFVTAHPEPKSFNHSLVKEAGAFLEQQGHAVRYSDLYAMQWQPVSDRRNFTTVFHQEYYKQQWEEKYATEQDGFDPAIQEEMEKLFWCDVLVLQFPLWWFGMPAIMKGWVDKVFAFEKIYARGKWFDTGIFKGKKALVSTTTGGGPVDYSPQGLHPDIATLLLPVHHGIFRFCGFEVAEPFVAWSVAHITQEERQDYIRDFQQKLLAL